jgi:hypothetical protein
MIDAATAVATALYTALNVTAVTNLAAVWQNPPEGTDPPVVVIGNIDLEPIGGKDGGLDKATADILTFIRQPDQTILFALQTAVRTQLDGQTITATGAALSQPLQTSSEVALMEDGETYMGTQRFEIFVQPA